MTRAINHFLLLQLLIDWKHVVQCIYDSFKSLNYTAVSHHSGSASGLHHAGEAGVFQHLAPTCGSGSGAATAVTCNRTCTYAIHVLLYYTANDEIALRY